jgi:hypothetical protein
MSYKSHNLFDTLAKCKFFQRDGGDTKQKLPEKEVESQEREKKEFSSVTPWSPSVSIRTFSSPKCYTNGFQIGMYVLPCTILNMCLIN